MARNSEEGEDEALSLSDLPLNFTNEETSLLQSDKEATQVKENEDDFSFDSWGGSVSAESEMCAADELFFKGQMLPLRLSVSSSSDSGLLARLRNLSRSESLDRGSSSMGGLTSINSSRSSSTRSHYSSSRSNSCFTNSRPKIRNQFHSFPSPKPQIRVSNSRLLGNGSRSQKSTTVWDFFRLGLVRAPEIELHNINSSVSRNSSNGSSSTNSSSSVKNYSTVAAKNQPDLKLGKQKKKQSCSEKRKGLCVGCKCSAVETIPLDNIIIIKSNTDHESSRSNKKESNSRIEEIEKKMKELKTKKKIKEKKQGNEVMSRHRTFEWLKELSHASYVDGNL